MSEETQKSEEHKEEVAPQQPETTPEASAETVEATTEETTTEATEVVAEEAAVSKPVEILTERPALAEPGDFDWDAFESDTDDYSKDDRTELEATYEDSLNLIREKEVVDGTIISISKKEVVVNIGYKSEGVVSANEFRYNPDLKVGDIVPIFIERQEDKNGQLVVSHRTARIFSAWDKINEAKEQDIIIQGEVKCRTKGGLIVDVFGIEAFLPGSQVDVKPIRDFDVYVGKQMDFKVVKINQEFKNVVVSHKALIEAELEEQKVEIMSKLEKGQVLEGTVKNITSYGVFVDLGGVDGLVHITDLSWGRINHPEELVSLDEKINVVILDFDDEKKRIALGLKQLQSHPWDTVDDNLKIGEKVKGKVVVLADYGAFVEISAGVEGLIHVSEMSWSQHLRTAKDFFSVGDEVEAVIMTLDRDERKMSLSTRRLTPDPWEDIEIKFPVESKHTAKVTNLSNFGVFAELDEGIDGLIHISDLSWSKKINHPSEFTKVGEDIEVVVLEIDKENRRLSLGHKQLEENPWDVFESVFTIGSVHQGTIINVVEKGALVALPYGVEAFAPGRHLVTEDGKKLGTEAQADFMVIEFKKDAKKIIVSHSKIHESKSSNSSGSDEGGSRKAPARGRQQQSRKAIQDLSDNLEKTTLGDLDALSALKSDMEEAEKKAKK